MTDPYALLREDPEMAPLGAEHGHLELEPAPDPFERLVVSIVRQQLSMASADAIRERLFDRFEITPQALRDASPQELGGVGLSGRKAATITTVAEAFDENDYSREAFAGRSDEAVMDELTAITGIGPWTAKMFLLFALAREDVFPVEDLGIRKGMATLTDEDLARSEMVERAERWRPYRSYAALYLWRVVD